MRGQDAQQAQMFSYVALEDRIPADHPLRSMRMMADTALRAMSPLFDRLYAPTGRDSIPPERLLVFDVREGWEPLCRFLDRPVPSSPFPRTNSKEEFFELVNAGMNA